MSSTDAVDVHREGDAERTVSRADGGEPRPLHDGGGPTGEPNDEFSTEAEAEAGTRQTPKGAFAEAPWNLTCGDGRIAPGEACDDGNRLLGDGCNDDCCLEPNFVLQCTSGWFTVARPCHCGDGIVDGTERCDDGNVESGDGCSSACELESPLCGNGELDEFEDCDDGNLSQYDGCDQHCNSEASCVISSDDPEANSEVANFAELCDEICATQEAIDCPNDAVGQECLDECNDSAEVLGSDECNSEYVAWVYCLMADIDSNFVCDEQGQSRRVDDVCNSELQATLGCFEQLGLGASPGDEAPPQSSRSLRLVLMP
jgi:cysteine-rich repeat protein